MTNPDEHDRIALLTPALGTANVGDHFIEVAIRRLLGPDRQYERFSTRGVLSREDLNRIRDCDVAVLCGTNLYQHRWESELSRRALRRMGVPIVPLGVGGSARRSEETEVSRGTRRMIRGLHRRCELGSVRDPHAAEVVERAGVSNAVLTGCPVLHWSGLDALPEVRPEAGRRIVVTARNWLMHREPDNVDNPVQTEFLTRVLDELPSDRVVFAVHEELDERLVTALGIPPSQVVSSLEPEEYIRLYSDPGNVVLAGRLHAGMLALANGAPAIFVGHDSRTWSFCDMVGLEPVDLFGQDAAGRAVGRTLRVLEGDVEEFQPVYARYRVLRPVMKRFLEANGLAPKSDPKGPAPPERLPAMA